VTRHFSNKARKRKKPDPDDQCGLVPMSEGEVCNLKPGHDGPHRKTSLALVPIEERFCSFCNKPVPLSIYLIKGYFHARICGPCITLCAKLVAEQSGAQVKDQRESQQLIDRLEQSLRSKST
jgi:hypothetical protein